MSDFQESLRKIQLLQKRPDGVTSDEWRTVQQGIRELQKRKALPFDAKQHKAQTQSDLAKMFIGWYFIILIVILVYVPAHNYVVTKYLEGAGDLLSARDAFMMVSSTVTPILAFVLGHYFKGKD